MNDNAATDKEASEEADHERMQALLSQHTSQLEDVKQALERIHDGTFGICISCGKEIGESRLRIVPTAKRCMDCEKK